MPVFRAIVLADDLNSYLLDATFPLFSIRLFVIFKLDKLRSLDATEISEDERKDAERQGRFLQVARPNADQYAQQGKKASLIEPQLRNDSESQPHARVAPVSYLGASPRQLCASFTCLCMRALAHGISPMQRQISIILLCRREFLQAAGAPSTTVGTRRAIGSL